MEVDEIKERQRGMWALADYSKLSEILRPAAVALCDACAVSAGQEVLDVGAGDGNFALACAAEGASVVAVRLLARDGGAGPRALARPRATTVEWVLGRRRGAALRGRALRLRGLGVRRDDRSAARGGGSRAVPGGAPGQHGGHDGLDARQLLLGAVHARAPLPAAPARRADARGMGGGGDGSQPLRGPGRARWTSRRARSPGARSRPRRWRRRSRPSPRLGAGAAQPAARPLRGDACGAAASSCGSGAATGRCRSSTSTR